MKDYSDIDSWTPKRLRTLRNNLNNRVQALGTGNEKNLGANHPLFGLEISDCKDLLDKIYKILKEKSR